MHRGYVKSWRKSEDSVAWSRGLHYRGLMITILHKTNRKPGHFRGVKINPGQLAMSMLTWSEELGIHRTTLRRMLQQLVTDEFITLENVANQFSLITVINWTRYQGNEEGVVPTDATTNATTDATTDATTSAHFVHNQCDLIKEGKNKKKTKVFSSELSEFRLAELLFVLIRQRNPEHKAPDLQSWARHVDLMLRVDGRSPERVEQVIRWAMKDAFWSKNILSTAKLREKFDALVMKMGGPAKPARDLSHLAAV